MSCPDFTADVIFLSNLEQRRKPSVSDPEIRNAKTNGSDNAPGIREIDSDSRSLHEETARKTADSTTSKENFSTTDGSSHDRLEVSIASGYPT
jgi:hypothetical protein